MARLNAGQKRKFTHEGAAAKNISPENRLRRSVMACLLWEDQFYEDGVSIAERIEKTVPLVKPDKVASIAREARTQMKLRHVPLLLAREMARCEKHKGLVGELLPDIIRRADELAEFVAIYWKDEKQPISAQAKKGLARAFTQFDAYQFAKYDRPGTVRLRDVMFLCRPKPKDSDQAGIFKKLAEGRLESPDTWEVSLSAGKNRKKTWQRLLRENKLGALALLRNLRNMKKAGVDPKMVEKGISQLVAEKVLPFRFITAARHAPEWEPQLEEAMFRSLKSRKPLPGRTVLLVDVSGSMDSPLSGRSEMTRMDAACGLAILLREICRDVRIFTFSSDFKAVPARRGFALRDAVVRSQMHLGTCLGQAVRAVYGKGKINPKNSSWSVMKFNGQGLKPDRLIVITDEQSHDPVPDPCGIGYMINVASYKNGVGYRSWLHIDGWSEAVIDYIRAVENSRY